MVDRDQTGHLPLSERFWRTQKTMVDHGPSGKRSPEAQGIIFCRWGWGRGQHGWHGQWAARMGFQIGQLLLDVTPFWPDINFWNRFTQPLGRRFARQILVIHITTSLWIEIVQDWNWPTLQRREKIYSIVFRCNRFMTSQRGLVTEEPDFDRQTNLCCCTESTTAGQKFRFLVIRHVDPYLKCEGFSSANFTNLRRIGRPDELCGHLAG